MITEPISMEAPVYQAALSLRYDLFFREHKLPRDIRLDELENSSIHIATTSGDNLIAYARLSDLGEGRYKISQVVVQPEHQGKGCGRTLLEAVVACAWEQGASVIELNARSFATGLCNGLGFIEVGEEYISEFTYVPHIKMELLSE